ncbi:MAG: peptide deformylase [Candidatus Hodgkinia cicadicola]
MVLACANRLTIAVLALQGCGINSIQVGQPVGMIITSCFNLGQRARQLMLLFANRLALVSKNVLTREGCLSVRKLFKRTIRCELITIAYVTALGLRARAFKTRGLLAICCQHELDHNAGSLIIDATDVDQ